jgi:protein TonB
MLDKIRLPSSIVFAIGITFVSFIGMSLLIKAPQYQKSSQVEMVNFSRIDDKKMPDMTQPSKKFEKPVKTVNKQPPATAKLDFSDSPNRDSINLPNGLAKINPYNFENMILTQLPGLTTDTDGIGGSDKLTQVIFIAPMYPPVAARNKTEGWVKIEFIVNEFGSVSKAKVIASKPRSIFNSAALRAIYKSKFKPLIIDGTARAQTAVQVIEFKLEK